MSDFQSGRQQESVAPVSALKKYIYFVPFQKLKYVKKKKKLEKKKFQADE